MIDLGLIYLVAGLLFGAWAVLGARDSATPKRWRNLIFWGLVATSFLIGDRLGDLGAGVLVIALALLAGLGGPGVGRPNTTTPVEREGLADRRGNWLFAAVLAVPVITLVLILVVVQPDLLGLPRLAFGGKPLLGAQQPGVVALAVAIVCALGLAMAWLRPRLITPLQEGRRLIDSIGWAALLPQALAALGGVFAAAGVGKAVGALTAGWIPQDNGLIAVCAYTGGMALFTVIMGNAFAAFPIMTAAIGLPLIVQRLHGDPAIMATLGMLSGFCGTLMTPMAANFNIVPAVLLELPDRNRIFNGVIRAQAPTGAIMLIVNTLLMYVLVYRF